MKILGIDHIGMAPKDNPQACNFLQSLLGLTHLGSENISCQDTKTTMFSSTHGNCSEQPHLELLEPLTEHSGPIGQFLNKKGSGIHHLALRVDNLQQAIQELLDKQVMMIDTKPRIGAHQSLIAFIHPKATGGLLIELVEYKKP